VGVLYRALPFSNENLQCSQQGKLWCRATFATGVCSKTCSDVSLNECFYQKFFGSVTKSFAVCRNVIHGNSMNNLGRTLYSNATTRECSNIIQASKRVYCNRYIYGCKKQATQPKNTSFK
jgi:hypothetical protein